MTKIEIIKKRAEERKKAVEGLVEEALKGGWASDRDQAYLFVPKSLTKNVILDVIEVGEVAVILHGDDRLGEGLVRVQGRGGEGGAQSDRGGLEADLLASLFFPSGWWSK